jgi:hypothetical protein
MDGPVPNFAFKFNLRRYIEAASRRRSLQQMTTVSTDQLVSFTVRAAAAADAGEAGSGT